MCSLLWSRGCKREWELKALRPLHFPARGKCESVIGVLQSLVANRQRDRALVPPESARRSYMALNPISTSPKCPAWQPQCQGGLVFARSWLRCWIPLDMRKAHKSSRIYFSAAFIKSRRKLDPWIPAILKLWRLFLVTEVWPPHFKLEPELPGLNLNQSVA